jgi:hypothetical protein
MESESWLKWEDIGRFWTDPTIMILLETLFIQRNEVKSRLKASKEKNLQDPKSD